MAHWRYDNSSAKQFVSEAIEKTAKFLAGYGVKCIFGKEFIKSFFSIILELNELNSRNFFLLISP
jgi:hypothetical protein